MTEVVYENGDMLVPTGPGWGMDVNEAVALQIRAPDLGRIDGSFRRQADRPAGCDRGESSCSCSGAAGSAAPPAQHPLAQRLRGRGQALPAEVDLRLRPQRRRERGDAARQSRGVQGLAGRASRSRRCRQPLAEGDAVRRDLRLAVRRRADGDGVAGRLPRRPDDRPGLRREEHSLHPVGRLADPARGYPRRLRHGVVPGLSADRFRRHARADEPGAQRGLQDAGDHRRHDRRIEAREHGARGLQRAVPAQLPHVLGRGDASRLVVRQLHPHHREARHAAFRESRCGPRRCHRLERDTQHDADRPELGDDRAASATSGRATSWSRACSTRAT